MTYTPLHTTRLCPLPAVSLSSYLRTCRSTQLLDHTSLHCWRFKQKTASRQDRRCKRKQRRIRQSSRHNPANYIPSPWILPRRFGSDKNPLHQLFLPAMKGPFFFILSAGSINYYYYVGSTPLLPYLHTTVCILSSPCMQPTALT